MPKMTEALINIRTATVLRDLARAMRVKVPRGNMGFRCPNPKCHQPVRAEKKGGTHGAHFEHLKKNPNCPLGMG